MSHLECVYICVCVQIYNMFPFVTAHCVDTETWIVDMGTNATASQYSLSSRITTISEKLTSSVFKVYDPENVSDTSRKTLIQNSHEIIELKICHVPLSTKVSLYQKSAVVQMTLFFDLVLPCMSMSLTFLNFSLLLY